MRKLLLLLCLFAQVALAAPPVSQVGHSYSFSVRNAYASTNVTTAAWVEIVASTSESVEGLTLFDSCGQTLELGVGAAGSEARKMLIPPGGIDGYMPLYINKGSRIALKAVSGNCTTGEHVLTGYKG